MTLMLADVSDKLNSRQSVVTAPSLILQKCVLKLNYVCHTGQLAEFDIMQAKKTSLKATSHSTIFDIPMRPLSEYQKHRHRFTR